MQVLSRVALVTICLEYPEAREQWSFPLMVGAWSITEVVRYSFYAAGQFGSPPYFLTWLRYVRDIYNALPSPFLPSLSHSPSLPLTPLSLPSLSPLFHTLPPPPTLLLLSLPSPLLSSPLLSSPLLSSPLFALISVYSCISPRLPLPLDIPEPQARLISFDIVQIHALYRPLPERSDRRACLLVQHAPCCPRYRAIPRHRER